MPRDYQLRENASIGRSVFLVICLILLGFAGYLAFFQEFQPSKWPLKINIKEQVELELAGEESRLYRYNKWEDFQALVNPSYLSNCKNKTILIIVKTGPKRANRREAYRKVLPKFQHLDGYDVQRVFVMGLNVNETFNGSEIQTEAAINDDMIVGNFSDSYINNTYKYMHSLKFAHSYCSNSPNAPFVILLDDDFMFKVENAAKFIKLHKPGEHLYAGNPMNGSPAIRKKTSKYYVSTQEFPLQFFPAYISGGCVVYSPKAIQDFYIAAQYLRMFRFDDVYEGV